jgi:hypothetical protein
MTCKYMIYQFVSTNALKLKKMFTFEFVGFQTCMNYERG